MPVACERLGESPSQCLRETAEEANRRILGLLLQGIDLDARPHASDEQLTAALAPIRAKLDMVVELLVQLSYRDVELPPRRRLELGERLIAWHADRAEAVGEWLRIRIYFDPVFREPVTVFAQVTECVPAGGDGGYRIAAAMAEVAEPVLDDIARLSLLVQRRQRTHRAAGARSGTW